MNDIPEHIMDWQREARTGVPEAVLCSHKSVAQIAKIIADAETNNRRLLLTRLKPKAHRKLSESGVQLDYDRPSRTAILGEPLPLRPSGIGVVAAGTSDMPVLREAVRTLAFSGLDCTQLADVGVAGLSRLMDRLDSLQSCSVIIAVAGMEGALFSVLGGLVRAPVIAVPSSVGYGVGKGGKVALHSALTACAPGVVAVNIDNGYGAAVAAMKLVQAASGSISA
ncbi:MAG TPA: nickel pincer cofactor biosynthesis protein LarB [Devosia sp.]|nr:nickel pincer cofactor biosynthesis protein LarB [Devosia sp.]